MGDIEVLTHLSVVKAFPDHTSPTSCSKDRRAKQFKKKRAAQLDCRAGFMPSAAPECFLNSLHKNRAAERGFWGSVSYSAASPNVGQIV